MPFDPVDFLDKHAIEYVTSGPNVARGHVAIRCPFCGDADPSQHMGVRMSDGVWGCFRDHTHRGKSPVRLVMALIHCTHEVAESIAGENAIADPDLVVERVRELLAKEGKNIAKKRRVHLPTEFYPITKKGPALKFGHYLRRRGFEHAEGVAQCYDLQACWKGPWKQRLIFLVWAPDGTLATWTGRDITGEGTVRYKTLSANPDKEEFPASESITELLWNYPDNSKGGKVLYVTEGPFDALKISYLGAALGVYATCLFGKTVSQSQATLLAELKPRYQNGIHLLLDRSEEMSAVSMLPHLGDVIDGISSVPEFYSDPGELDEEGLQLMLKADGII